MYDITLSLILISLIGTTSCGNGVTPRTSDERVVPLIGKDTSSSEITTFQFQYDLDKPSQTFKLSNEIQEISGLSSSKNPEELLSINDEKGIAFVIDARDGHIVKKYRFDKNKDYEGIESVDDKIYVVESNGTLYQISKPGSKDQSTEKIHTPMSFRNDIEGLGYDETRHELILACKANGSIGDNLVKGKAFYRYSLTENKLIDNPYFRVSKNDINNYFKSRGLEASKHHLKFEPSAVAVHPVTKNIYALASVGKKLIILDGKTFAILYIAGLKPKIYKQPEGLCFLDDGTMYIASEGHGGKARLFELQRN